MLWEVKGTIKVPEQMKLRFTDKTANTVVIEWKVSGKFVSSASGSGAAAAFTVDCVSGCGKTQITKPPPLKTLGTKVPTPAPTPATTFSTGASYTPAAATKSFGYGAAIQATANSITGPAVEKTALSTINAENLKKGCYQVSPWGGP